MFSLLLAHNSSVHRKKRMSQVWETILSVHSFAAMSSSCSKISILRLLQSNLVTTRPSLTGKLKMISVMRSSLPFTWRSTTARGRSWAKTVKREGRAGHEVSLIPFIQSVASVPITARDMRVVCMCWCPNTSSAAVNIYRCSSRTTSFILRNFLSKNLRCLQTKNCKKTKMYIKFMISTA